jgi:hypothetical protein
MPVDVGRVLRQALEQLDDQRIRLARQITAVRQAMKAVDGAVLDGGSRLPRAPTRRRRRTRMSVAARRALSVRMKAYWAKRRSGQKQARRSTKK